MRRAGPGLTKFQQPKDRPAPSEPGRSSLKYADATIFPEYLRGRALFFVAGTVLFLYQSRRAFPIRSLGPVLLLSLATFLSRRRELLPFGFAFLFSAAGDAVGARGLFIPQMAFFALAHAAYVCWFLPRARRRLRAVSLAVTVPLLVFLFAAIVPEAPFPAERIGVAVYGLVIAAMLYSALQYDGACAPPDSGVRPCCSSFPTR